MYRVLWNASVLASGSAGALVFFRKWKSFHQNAVFAESPDESKQQTAQKSSALDLELKQVQVFFRHGARTPLYVLEGYRQAPYHVDFLMRPHPLTLFPYERVLTGTLQPCDWAAYEYSLRRRNIFGGSMPGQLTSFGQEQMYGLGLRLRDAYATQLDLATFDPNSMFLLSTNINRTVQSARCVMAGIYGNEELHRYASQHGPIKLEVADKPINILIPDTKKCDVLRKVNHASLLHFDFVSPMKADRETVEKHIDEVHDSQQARLTKAQEEVTKNLTRGKQTTASRHPTSSVTFNSERQPYTHDQGLVDALNHRNEAIDPVTHFWHNAISHHAGLGPRMAKEEVKGLLALQRMDREEFDLKFKNGYRFTFHFDANPYFHNRVITKEVCRMADGTLKPTHTTRIQWKEGGAAIRPDHKPTVNASKEGEGEGHPVSFFSWLTETGIRRSVDEVGDSLEEVWRNPLESYKHVSYKMDHSTTKKINFVFLYDDTTARVTHGWEFPPGLDPYKTMVRKNGARMMFYAMTGRHKRERVTVTGLSVGRLLTDMVDRAEGLLKGDNSQKLCLYSSHDSTMVALLESLGLWQHVWPPFGADLRLEIYQDRKSKDCFVKVVLQGQAALVRGQREELVPWAAFKEKVVGPYLMDQTRFDQICASNFLEEVAKDVLEHEEGEKPDEKESKKISETPAGM